MKTAGEAIGPGRWVGDLHILQPDGTAQSVPMQLTIAQTGSGEWSWIIQYGGQEARNYKLIQTRPETNQFVMDEGNGILLDGYRIGDSLYFLFEVQDSRLICRYQFDRRFIQMDILSGRSDENRLSGDRIQVQDTIPPVQSAGFRFFQSARLRKT